MPEVTAIILAGGKNLRLGRNKALEKLGGQSLIERAIERLKVLSPAFVVVTAQDTPPLLLSDVRVVADIMPGRGPLGGIYSGLARSETLHNIVVACDMPFLNPTLFRYMLDRAPGFDIVVPRLGAGLVEPLHAVYDLGCLPAIKDRLGRNELQTNRLLDSLSVRYIERAECRELDPDLRSFFNINRQADLDKAVALLAEESAYKVPADR